MESGELDPQTRAILNKAESEVIVHETLDMLMTMFQCDRKSAKALMAMMASNLNRGLVRILQVGSTTGDPMKMLDAIQTEIRTCRTMMEMLIDEDL